MKILIPIIPKNYYSFTLIRRHAERQKSALRHGSPMRDPMAGRPLRTRKRNGRRGPDKKTCPIRKREVK
ncbi:MAG: hypothetical protein C6W56_13200 [Caldibacillus debilis]|nr:MAG: hypothetical protein C6W56_13200 [Caldibacillus debilis]